MKHNDVQAFINALVSDYEKADVKIQASIMIATEQREPLHQSNDERIRSYAKMLTIREVLLHMDQHLPGTKRMVRRALEKIEPAFASGYYSRKKGPTCSPITTEYRGGCREA